LSDKDKNALIAEAEAKGVTIDKRWSPERIRQAIDDQPTPAEVAAAANTSPSQSAAENPPVQSEAGGNLDLPADANAGEKLVAAAGQVGPSQGFALTAEAIISTLEGAPYELLVRLEEAITEAKRNGPKPGGPTPAQTLLEDASSIQTINQGATEEISPAEAAALSGIPESEYTSHVVRQLETNGRYLGPKYLIVYDNSGKHAVAL
jgi:hypothetical protein